MKKTFIDEMEKWFNSLSGEQLIKTWNDFTNGMDNANIYDDDFFAKVKDDLSNIKNKQDK
jgi:hypothetical protein